MDLFVLTLGVVTLVFNARFTRSVVEFWVLEDYEGFYRKFLLLVSALLTLLRGYYLARRAWGP